MGLFLLTKKFLATVPTVDALGEIYRKLSGEISQPG
jgi:hypothetical protein